MIINRTRFLFNLLLIPFLLSSQNKHEKDYSILFYNVENLFDCDNDSLTNDDEFTPTDYKHWTPYRFYQKVNGISKVILSANAWNPPQIIGLCEIENTYALKQLIYHSGLNNQSYRYIHFDSPDKRGIDVALLYRSKYFAPIESYPINCSNTESSYYTRDILYCKGVMLQSDTLHIFVNHWPSKRGGELASEKKRIVVAERIAEKVDSIYHTDIKAKIIVMGDFNATMNAESLHSLITHQNLCSILQVKSISNKPIAGSHKYQGEWSLIDHILISEGLANSQSLKFEHEIIQFNYLLEEDKSYSGFKPRRTYAGPRYIGGVSDHLPVILKVKKRKGN
ncbi:endonuclease/exonuclease/phosphatase family protein [Carboxylicivirga sp. N1Y90]|uniref:endonuclease/exonuclease/phosphatase family protein n=1 Tax=Carboxylicivirga fragile TaxID=3417571 RepID=UPI003D34CE5B|nr:endonuclease [Marinilabiliaceae bacterium N1Y90]